jgi:hypothetical protein
MGHSVHYDDEKGILIATQTGKVTLESRLLLLEEGKALLPEGCKVRVLSDLRDADLDMNSDELIQYGEIVARDPRSHGARVATVYRSDDPIYYLGESILQLQGKGVKVASFISMEEAYHWLTEE